MTIAKQTQIQVRRQDGIYTPTAGRKREARSPRARVGEPQVAKPSSSRTKSTIMIIVIPSYLIRCKTVVSTMVVGTQGLGAHHKSRKGCGLGGSNGGDACRIWQKPERAAAAPTHPHCKVPISISAPKLGPGDDRVGSRAGDMHVRSTFSTNLISSL